MWMALMAATIVCCLSSVQLPAQASDQGSAAVSAFGCQKDMSTCQAGTDPCCSGHCEDCGDPNPICTEGTCPQ